MKYVFTSSLLKKIGDDSDFKIRYDFEGKFKYVVYLIRCKAYFARYIDQNKIRLGYIEITTIKTKGRQHYDWTIKKPSFQAHWLDENRNGLRY